MSSHVRVSACVNRNGSADIISAASEEGVPGERTIIGGKLGHKGVKASRVGRHGLAPGDIAISSHVHVSASVDRNGAAVITSAASKKGMPGE